MERELSVPLDSSFVISIIGQRRAGKTYYLFQLSREMSDYIYLNFEDSRLYGVNHTELRDIIRTYIEISRVSRSVKIIKILRETPPAG